MKKTAKILLIDDFELMRVQLKNELAALGYENLSEAADGEQACYTLLNAGAEPYDFVFCDWNMPGKNGLDVLNFMRESSSYAKTPFVLVTSESENQVLVQMIQAGADDYILKPIASEELRIRLEKLFNRIQKNKAA